MPRLVLPTLYNGPVPVKLDELAAIDGPQKPGTCEVLEGTPVVATEQGQSTPAERSGALGPAIR
ncbi:MAG: hypothetical protein WBG18_02905 [Xanthobacteraceae bacterium]